MIETVEIGLGTMRITAIFRNQLIGVLFAAVVLMFTSVTATAGPARDLSGNYLAFGTNIEDGSPYKCKVTITKNGETYKVEWLCPARYTGTGIVMDDIFAVTYMDDKKTWLGVMIYKILPDNETLEGKWSPHLGRKLGNERLELQ